MGQIRKCQVLGESMRSRKFLQIYRVILLILVIISGCATPETQDQIQLTATTGSFPEATQTYPVGATATQTLPRKQPTLSHTPTKTLLPPTLTSQPTLNVSQEKKLLQGLLQNNGNCRLPCLWGITPGISGLDSLYRILSPFNNISIPKDFYIDKSSREASGSATFILWRDKIRVPIIFSYYITGASIDYLTLNFEAGRESEEGANLIIKAVDGDPFFLQTLAYYRLSNILAKYGMPSEVIIAPFPDDPQYPADTVIPFSFVLFYKTEGIFLEYISAREKSGQSFVGCPTRSGYLSVIVWDPRQNVSTTEIASKTSGVGINSMNVDYFQPLENATTMTLQDFYKIFKDPSNTTCIETSVDVWK
jgi:hypothetical protein